MRLPREPYPGLRPFLDFEAALLFGRERQVREIIERLAQTQFVAVLGGSGSGKSSLVHAGVTPALRSFGIPGAGDLWLPMACTPGTNVATADATARTHTPITRLARRFGALLRSRGSEEADRQRLADIAEAFRQEAGFARLLDAYADELDIPPGPDPKEARVLFVLDQFEEIFHPTNKGVADASLLVERVLDHFFAPHPRCYVVLTMRSEHLNDCAAYLELPDAINRSSYLVRRLDADELRDAITGPAQRFLRLMARSNPARKLPEQVRFEPAVIERLLRDVTAITHDPDHLPLLQHLLARLWQAALEREEVDVPVPSDVTEIDLVRAVDGGMGGGVGSAGGDEQPLDERLNTLRACVDNWPEKLYLWHDEPQRRQLEAVFRQLAFKDPNTGLYSQQRIDVDAAAPLLGPGKTAADLRALVGEGFLGSVDYLFWDDEDASRVTLKVSHESFIRGWMRFRRLVDVESERFDQFVGLMRKAADWVEHDRNEDFLLETGELRRLREGDIESGVADVRQMARWSRFLALDRDGARLARALPALGDFVALAESRQRERQRREQFLRRGSYAIRFVAVVLGLLPIALFAVFVQTPTVRRAELLFDAGKRANRAAVTPSYERIGATDAALDSLLQAAELVDQARSGAGLGLARTSEYLLDHLDWIGPVQRQGDFLDGVLAQSEPLVNGRLRQLLTGAIFRAAPRMAGDTLFEPPQVMAAVCSLVANRPDDESNRPPAAGSADAPRGTLYVAGRAADGRPRAAAAAGGSAGTSGRFRRAIFIPERNILDHALLIYSATWNAQQGRCVLGPSVLSSPAALDSYAVFDAGLRVFMYSVEAAGGDAPAVIAQELDWYWGRYGQIRSLHRHPVTVITDRRAVARVRAAAGPERAAPLPTWRQGGGRAVEIEGQRWRFVSEQARPVPVDLRGPEVRPLEPAGGRSPCAAVATSVAGLAGAPGFRVTAFDAPQGCLVVQRGRAEYDASIGAIADAATEAGEPPREELRVALYARPNAAALERLAGNPPAPLASVAPYARLAPEVGESLHWALASGGTHDGWVLMSRPQAAGGAIVVGAPMTTCALWRLGRQIQAANPAPAAPAASAAVDTTRTPPAIVCD